MKKEKLYNPEEVEISRDSGKKLSKIGSVIKYKSTIRIKSVKGLYCRGCCFNSENVVGCCPYYIDGGKKKYPCMEHKIV